MPGRRHTLVAAGTLVSLSLVLTACGGDEGSAEDPTTPVSTANALLLNGEWPLTGEKLDGDLPKHPVYVVKIDNTTNSAPQHGLDSADMVAEELVEGGFTRLVAFYYQDAPGLVGPVRSMRASDIPIVKPTNAVIIAAGGAASTKRRVAAAGISNLGEGSPGFERDDSRSAPYNLYAHLSQIAAHPTGRWEPPAGPYFQFGDTDLTDARQVTKISAEFSGAHTTDWVHTDKGWVRTNSNAEKGHDFSVDTVLLLRVREGDAGYLDPAHNPVPETLLHGSGAAILVHGDKALVCRWQKTKDPASTLVLTTKSGHAVNVPPGHTFVELVPAETGKVTLTK